MNLTLIELHREYAEILRIRKIKLKPAILEIFDSEKHWGQWDSASRTLRISNKLLQTQPWHHVIGVLKHEMAHQVVDELYEVADLHGEYFKKACELVGVPKIFTKASVNLQESQLDWREEKRDQATEARMEKVRKLLSLASSANEHEALLAMNKVRELYSRYNLEKVDIEPEFVHLVIAKGLKRIDLFEKKILNILIEHFFVQALIGNSYDVQLATHSRTLEVIGSRENVLMAEYVYYFLVNHIDLIVQQKKLNRVEKKSYRLGILEGFSEKLQMPVDPVVQRALVVFKKDSKLGDYLRFIYPRLKYAYSNSQQLSESYYAAGKSEGRKLILNMPITSKSESFCHLLGH